MYPVNKHIKHSCNAWTNSFILWHV